MPKDNNTGVLLAEYNSLRSESMDNCRGMVSLFLYMVIIIATIFGASISKGRYESTIFLMPLLAPLLLVRNSLYRANVRITHYIATQITPKLPELGWSEYVEARSMCRVLIDLSSYRLLNYYYLAIAFVPNLIFIPGQHGFAFRALQVVNVVIASVVALTTFGCTRGKLLKRIAEQSLGAYSSKAADGLTGNIQE